MEKDLKFSSAVCTSRVQSERLLALGLKKETADMFYDYCKDRIGYTWYLVPKPATLGDKRSIPAWSLHRLLSILNEDDSIIDITVKDGRYGIHYGYDIEWYDDLYDGMIAVFGTLIKEGYFNKEYLV